MTWAWARGGLVVALAACASLHAQGTQTDKTKASKPQLKPVRPPHTGPEQDPLEVQAWQKVLEPFAAGYSDWDAVGDRRELLMTRGVIYKNSGLEIRADSGVAFWDRDETGKLMQWGSQKIPRRGSVPAPSRRRLDEEVIRTRLNSLLQSMGQKPLDKSPETAVALRSFRSLYLEGHVIVLSDGVEMVRAKRLFISTVDDRAVFHEVLMRLISYDKQGQQKMLILRAPRLVRQGKITSGRNVSVTTCTAGEPHFEVYSGQLEIHEREKDFRVKSRSNSLAFGRIRSFPLPDVDFFTSDQSQIPIKSASARYDENEKTILKVGLGGSMNRLGGTVHNWLTGRDPSEFRGEWYLGLGYNQERGWPVEGELEYEVERLYRGKTFGFYLDDNGHNIRQIQRKLDGQLIDNENRWLYRTENRFHFGEDTYLDTQLWNASDAAVWSEFFPREYMREEIPETSLYFRHTRDNLFARVEGRFNAANFSYADDRSQAPFFTEKIPQASLDLFSEKLTDLPGGGQLLLTSSTEVGQQRSNFDHSIPRAVDDRVFRVDQGVELTAPYYFGPVAFLPFVNAGFTHYDRTTTGDHQERGRFGAGASVATRLAKVFGQGQDAEGNAYAFQHIMNPVISFDYLYHVDGDQTDYYQHDIIDASTERAALTFGLVNRFKYRSGEQNEARVREFVWMDLQQTVFPISGRDNAGHHLGFFDYELIGRPLNEWNPVPNMRLILKGQYDWNESETRKFNVGVQFGKVLGVNWGVEWRKDETTRGAIGYSADTQLFERWFLAGRGQYDLEESENMDYVMTLARNDHDWIISMELRYDEVTDSVSFQVNFEPKFGGLFRAPRQPVFGGNVLRGRGALTNY